jgi:hypothetical protein
VHIGTTEATPGYVPGPLPTGKWIVQVDTHMIMPGEVVHYWLDISITEGARLETEPAFLSKARSPKTPQRGAGWYRGDLHSHSHHSDAGEHTVAGLIQTAQDYGLDFVFLTDHNTTAGLEEMQASSTKDLLAAGGVEVTTFWGHALCLGTRAWVDWRVRPGTGDMTRIATATYANDQVFVIAHPQSDGDPACTGCTWRFGEMMPGVARVVEIWNGPWGCDSNNEAALSLWYDWLNQGLHVVATAGTDAHSAQDYAAKPGFNVVYAEALSEAALLKALRAGQFYLSSGPQLSFQARNENGETWIIGETVTLPVRLAVAWADCPADAQVRSIANGRLLGQWMAGARGEYEWHMTPDQADWVVMEIRGGNGGLLAISNPIFFAAEGRDSTS